MSSWLVCDVCRSSVYHPAHITTLLRGDLLRACSLSCWCQSTLPSLYWHSPAPTRRSLTTSPHLIVCEFSGQRTRWELTMTKILTYLSPTLDIFHSGHYDKKYPPFVLTVIRKYKVIKKPIIFSNVKCWNSVLGTKVDINYARVHWGLKEVALQSGSVHWPSCQDCRFQGRQKQLPGAHSSTCSRRQGPSSPSPPSSSPHTWRVVRHCVYWLGPHLFVHSSRGVLRVWGSLRPMKTAAVFVVCKVFNIRH